MTSSVEGLVAMGAGGVLAFAILWQAVVLIPRSRWMRTDVRPGEPIGAGASRFWQWNVYNPRNYRSDAGRRFFRKLLLAVALQFISTLILGILFMAAM